MVDSWRMHLAYLRYVLVHKWWVLVWGLRLEVPLWQLIIHDMSKFSRQEWGPYARWFYTTAPDGRGWYTVYREGMLLHPGCMSEPWRSARNLKGDFDQAWSHHWRHNPHHPEYHAPSGMAPQIMPDVYMREMVADWYGAGYAKGERDVLWWYQRQKEQGKMRLHVDTRMAVERLLAQM